MPNVNISGLTEVAAIDLNNTDEMEIEVDGVNRKVRTGVLLAALLTAAQTEGGQSVAMNGADGLTLKTAADNGTNKWITFLRQSDNAELLQLYYGASVIKLDFNGQECQFNSDGSGSTTLVGTTAVSALRRASDASAGTLTWGFNGGDLLTLTGATTAGKAMFRTTISVASVVGSIIKAAASQSADVEQWHNSSDAVMCAIAKNGAFKPASLDDVDAENSTMYYSITASKLVYKDAGGTVNYLY